MEIRKDKYKNTSDFQGRSGSATLNMEKLSLFMDSMISNYNKPELAVFREWVSNAHDAHVAAGVKAPVKVTLPTRLSPTLVVQDVGLGMTADFVENVYLSFGSSSKDESNKEIGGFGQGGKSALAIASQYTMTTIAGGLKNIYIFERSPMGGVDFKLVLEDAPTDEPSGTTVQVAVDRIEQFSEVNINRVLAGWSNADIELSSGKEFFSIPDNSTLVNFTVDMADMDDSKTLIPGEDVREEKGYVLQGALDITGKRRKISQELNLDPGDHVVLVGPVAYTFRPDTTSKRVIRDYMVASVGIGDVSFPSSREVIEPTRNNRRFVAEVLSRVADAANGLLQKEADSLSDHKAAFALNNSPLAQHHKGLKVTFRGETIPNKFIPQISDSIFTYEHTGGRYGSAATGYRIVENHFGSETEFRLTVQSLVVVDDKSSTQSIRNNMRLRHEDLGEEVIDLAGHLVISPTPNPWVEAAAQTVIKSSELAEQARAVRKRRREVAEANAAAGIVPADVVRRTRRDRIGEYLATWGSFGKDAEGKLSLEFEDSDLMDFFDSHFDPKKTLVLSTNKSSYSLQHFTQQFLNFSVNPQDAQFLSVDTGAKIETLRVLLGEEVKIVGIEEWMTENFASLAKVDGRRPSEIVKDLPFDVDHGVRSLINSLGGTGVVHPKYAELIETQEELDAIRKTLGTANYRYNSGANFVRNLLEGFDNAQIEERPEFYFLEKVGYWVPEFSEKKKLAIRQTMNQMMENWLDNLALEEAEAEESAEEAARIAAQKEPAAEATLSN